MFRRDVGHWCVRQETFILPSGYRNSIKLPGFLFASRKKEQKWRVVRDGQEALDFLFCANAYAERDPDDMPKLVLLDIKLPKIDGLEVLRRVRAEQRTSLVPIVMLISSKEQEDRIKAYQAGANSYIRKPVDFSEFIESVRLLGMYWLMLNMGPVN